ncbi:MAG: hypothetical protein RI894_1837 [Bacteroidota bacterium]|jgi:enterochelin esterase-like enzyme
MKFFFIISIACCLASCFPKTATITYRISTAKPLSQKQTVYIAGNQPQLGEWQPNKIAFSRENDSVFMAKIRLPLSQTRPQKTTSYGTDSVFVGKIKPPITQKTTSQKTTSQEIAYKFTRGTWEAEETTKDGTIPPNQTITIRKDTLITHRIEGWKDQYFKPKGQVTGKLQHITAWKGEGIEPRNVHIWLPPNYDSTGKTRYSVIYCHDGQNLFDPKTASFGMDWQLDETADSLIKNGICQPFLMVAMDCTKNRTAEYAYETQGENYQKWIVNTVKPYIDKNFPTLPDAKNTAILGSSMGGLCALELAWNYPTVFGHAACFSPAFRIKKTENSKLYDLDFIPYAQKSAEFKNIDLYIDNGTLDLEARLQPGIDDMMQFLNTRKQPFTWFLDKGATHNEAAWAKRAWRPLVQFFKK